MKRLAIFLIGAALCAISCGSPVPLTMPFPEGHGTSAAYIGRCGDEIIIAGGSDFLGLRPWEGGSKTWLDGIWAIRKEGRSFSCTQLDSKLPCGMGGGVCASDGITLYCIGGTLDDGTRSDCIYAINPDDDSCICKKLCRMPDGFIPSAAAADNGMVYICGTMDGENSFMRMDLSTILFEVLAPCPGTVISEGGTLIPMTVGGERVFYMIGGRSHDESGYHFASNVWEYVPSTDTWTRRAEFNDGSKPIILMYSAVCPVSENEILIFGGDDGEELLVRDSLQRAGDTEGLAQAFINHKGFVNKVFSYDAAGDKWTVLKESSEPIPAVSTAAMLDGVIFIPGGEAHPGVRSNRIITYKP